MVLLVKTPDMSQVMDIELISAFEKHRDRLLRSVESRLDARLKVRLDPEDILQQVYVVASAKSQENRSAMDEYVWWYGIARDCLVEEWRKNSRQMRDVQREIPLPDHSSILLSAQLAGGGPSPSSAVGQRELRERVEQTIAEMDDQDQDVLWMRLFEDLRYNEIAEVLGISVDNATKRYSRALLRLRQLLGDIRS